MKDRASCVAKGVWQSLRDTGVSLCGTGVSPVHDGKGFPKGGERARCPFYKVAVRAVFAAAVIAECGSASAGTTIPASAYVQDGLILQWDGIENAGVGQHDESLTKWVDLSGHGNDGEVSAMGAFKADRLAADEIVSGARWSVARKSNLTGVRTIESFLIWTGGDNTGGTLWANYPTASGKTYQDGPVPNARVDQRTWSSAYGVVGFHYADGIAPTIKWHKAVSGEPFYAAYVANEAGTSYEAYLNGVATGVSYDYTPIAAGISFNGFDTHDRRSTGAIHAVRLYSRSLTADEIAYNALVDKLRFVGDIDGYRWNGQKSQLEVRLSLASEDERGTFEVGGVPVSVVWGGADETVTVVAQPKTGWAFDHWEGDIDGLTAAECVTASLTLKFGKSPRRLVAVFCVSSDVLSTAYVQDGLILHWDGIDNAGRGTHDSTARVWKDLSGSGNDGELTAMGSFAANRLTADRLVDGVYWSVKTKDAIEKAGTMEAYLTWTGGDPNTGGTLWANYPTEGGSYLEGPAPNARVNHQAAKYGEVGFYYGTAVDFRWHTATVGEPFYAAYVANEAGTSYEAYLNGAATGVTYAHTPKTAGISFNGFSGNYRRSTGAIYAVRLYSRSLTADEIAYNRAIDSLRFEGAADGWRWNPQVGKVEIRFKVCCDEVCGTVTANGASEVWGQTGVPVALKAEAKPGYVFTGWTEDVDGIDRAERLRPLASASVGYVPHLVRANFRRDSGIPASAYVQDGLILQWDGLENAGAGKYDPMATVWKDLSGKGNDGELTAMGAFGGDRLLVNLVNDCQWAVKTPELSGVRTIESYVCVDGGDMTTTGTLWAGYPDNEKSPVPHARVRFYEKPYAIGFKVETTGLLSGIWQQDCVLEQPFGVAYVSADGTSYEASVDGVATGVTTEWPTTEGAMTFGGFKDNNRRMSGSFGAVRLYSRALTADEVAYNAALDRLRFAGVTDGCRWNARARTVEFRTRASSANAHGTTTVDGGKESWGAYGDTVTLSAVPDEGYVFSGWCGDTAGFTSEQLTSGSVTFTRGSVPRRLYASFRRRGISSADYVQEGLIAQWDGEDNFARGLTHPAATTWTDLVGGTETTANGTLVFAGAAAVFDGNVYLSGTLPAAIEAISNGAFTAEAYLRPECFRAHCGIFTFGSMTYSGCRYLTLNSQGSADGFFGAVQYRQSIWNVTNSTTNLKLLLDNKPILATVVADGGRAKFYTNGVEVASVPCGDVAKARDNSFMIGSFVRIAGNSGIKPGEFKCHAVRFYNRCLSCAEISANAAVDAARFTEDPNGEPYLLSDGTAAVDTGYLPGPNTRLVADYRATQVEGGRQLFGAYDDSSRALVVHHYLNGSSGETTPQYAWGASDRKSNFAAMNPPVEVWGRRTLFDLDLFNSRVILETTGADGVSVTNAMTTTRTMKAANSLAIFARHSSADVYELNSRMKLYSFKIYEKGKLKRCLVPHRGENGQVGLKDLCHGGFYPSVTGSGLEYGRDLLKQIRPYILPGERKGAMLFVR